MKKEILNKIKEYDKIIIHRHVSPDPDAMGSQMGMYHIIKENFPKKQVFVTGVFPERLSYFNAHSRLDDEVFHNALIIVTDTANSSRIDDERYEDGSFIIKIDHHPVNDNFGDINWVESSRASTSEMIYEFYDFFKDELTLSLEAQEYLLSGIVADTNRFLYSATSSKTFKVAQKMKDNGVDFKKVYDTLYRRPFNDLKYFAFILSNLKVEDNLAHIVISEQDIKNNNTDVATSSNMIGELGNVDDFVVWVFITEDKRNKNYRVNIRSRGPIINDVAAKYGGGGHTMASGLRIKNLDKLDDLLYDLKSRIKEFLNE